MTTVQREVNFLDELLFGVRMICDTFVSRVSQNLIGISIIRANGSLRNKEERWLSIQKSNSIATRKRRRHDLSPDSANERRTERYQHVCTVLRIKWKAEKKVRSSTQVTRITYKSRFTNHLGFTRWSVTHSKEQIGGHRRRRRKGHRNRRYAVETGRADEIFRPFKLS